MLCRNRSRKRSILPCHRRNRGKQGRRHSQTVTLSTLACQGLRCNSPNSQQRPHYQQAAQPIYVHPGLDHRGPSWHVPGALLKCRYQQCNGLFCQCCAQHGHTAEACRKRLSNPSCNPHGYYSDQRPTQGPVEYIPYSGAQQQPRPATRFGPPPTASAAPPPPFPTPHIANSMFQSSDTPRTYTPVHRTDSSHVSSTPSGPPVNSTRVTDAQSGSDAPPHLSNASRQ